MAPTGRIHDDSFDINPFELGDIPFSAYYAEEEVVPPPVVRRSDFGVAMLFGKNPTTDAQRRRQREYEQELELLVLLDVI